ncbi:translation initiation factor IF-2-like [Lolium rigidum]|uniref:translation initiation factor IF-2-like n=1 Tax=Lolium rigidum TaxID=89674 RepID=UPI001F5D40D8|nr:translation initiation factor IF-2-like [Lolium rigidum]
MVDVSPGPTSHRSRKRQKAYLQPPPHCHHAAAAPPSRLAPPPLLSAPRAGRRRFFLNAQRRRGSSGMGQPPPRLLWNGTFPASHRRRGRRHGSDGFVAGGRSCERRCAIDLTDAAATGAASRLAEAPRRAASPSRLAEAPAAEPPSPVSWRHLAVEERRGTKAGLCQEATTDKGLPRIPRPASPSSRRWPRPRLRHGSPPAHTSTSESPAASPDLPPKSTARLTLETAPPASPSPATTASAFPYNHLDLRRRLGAHRRRSSSLQLPQGHPTASTIPAPPPGLPWRGRPKIRLPGAPCSSPSLLVELIHGGHRARWRIRGRTVVAVSSRCAKGGRREDPFSRCCLNWAMILQTISVD